ncbi:hypothetical protein KJ836_00610 [Patescibacteria group bacterium]|nr:hypothetical protein [Patescibacteria group bacterium]
MTDKIQNLDEFIAKVDAMKKQDKMDLSSDQDLSIAIMNLISIEEHFFFTGNKTDKTGYFDMINEVRDLRKELLKKIVKDPEGEVWCISKHLLAASMRLMEVGTKQLGMGKKEEAYDLFDKAYQMYSLFWGLNMGAIDVDGVKNIDEGAINKTDTKKTGFLGKLGELVKKALDCCLE